MLPLRVSLALALSLPLALTVLGCGDEHGEATAFESKLGRGPAAKAALPAEDPQGEHLDAQRGAPGVREDGEIVFAVDWFEGSLEQALSRATSEDKLVFVEVGAYWCPPCHELEEQVFTDPRVGAWLEEHAVAVHIDAEKGEGPELVDRYAIQ
ncbi:MAG: DUF255 domain-containing protein, partial [Myxococcales bacterium]|nr:DUF255 domain-containing protein [Myxococcales bacterium]